MPQYDSAPGEQVDNPGHAGPGMQLALQANDMWFADPSDGEPLTFREVFLKSQALENIVAGDGPSQASGTTSYVLIGCVSAFSMLTKA